MSQLTVSPHNPKPQLFGGLNYHPSSGFSLLPQWFSCCDGTAGQHQPSRSFQVRATLMCALNRKLSRLATLLTETPCATAHPTPSPAAEGRPHGLPPHLAFKDIVYAWLMRPADAPGTGSQRKGQWILSENSHHRHDPLYLATLITWHSPLSVGMLTLDRPHDHLDLSPYLDRDIWIVTGLHQLHQSSSRNVLERVIDMAHKAAKPLWVVSSPATSRPHSAAAHSLAQARRQESVSEYVRQLRQQPPWYFMSASSRAKWQDITWPPP